MSQDPFHDLFERAAPPASSAVRTRKVLDDVRPAFVRARRHHRLRVAAAAVTTSVLLAGGAAALVSIGGNADPIDPRSVPTPTVADRVTTDDDPVEAPTIDDPEVPEVDGAADDPITAVPEPSEAPAVDPAVPDPADTSELDDDPADPEGAELDDDPAEPEGADHEDDDPDDDDHEASTTTVATGEPTVASTAGGSVTVTFDGNAISIQSVDPAPGFTAEVTESDPTEIKVYFRNGAEEYEVEIQVEAGELRVDTEEPDDS